MDAGKASGLGAVPLRARLHRDAGRAQLVEQPVDILHAQVEHPWPVGGEVVGVVLEGHEHGRTGLLRPGPGIADGPNAEMLDIPGLQRFGVARPEK
ncbi:hypothetical protein D3C81_2103530 [compost metagenome]